MPKKRRRILICLGLAFAILVFSIKPSLKMLFPLAYEDLILGYTHEYELSSSLAEAIIWCESRYRPEAVSPMGACGLMQLTPATFRELCSELSLLPNSDIHDPATNIRCGTFYLQKLLKRFPALPTALAAYNAGIGNVTKWLADPRYSHDGKTLHTIPFAETRRYVKRVLAVQEIYEKLYPKKGDS